MILFKKADDIRVYLIKLKEQGNKLGFIPTMGALHAGHISLLNLANENGFVSVCSIFVNPTQFNDSKDFDKYPVTIEKDIDLLEKAGCAVLFIPDTTEIYPNGFSNSEKYELGYLENILEGKFRPGHFQGVCMVVHRLLTIIPCNQLFIGQKDYQQCMVIKKLVELKKINTGIMIGPTLREADGLAMSSRNVRLMETDRKQATKIFEKLSFIKNNIKPGDLNKLKQRAVMELTDHGFKVDYIEIANAGNLDVVNQWDGDLKLVAVAAAFLGEVRLIDNLFLEE